MTTDSELFDIYAQNYDAQKQSEMSLKDYLDACRNDASMYASAAERMIKAIGEPDIIDTQKDPRIGRIFLNRTIKIYPAFKDFYGLEETIDLIDDFEQALA